MKKIENKYFSYSVYSDGSGGLYYGEKDGKFWEHVIEYGTHKQKVSSIQQEIKNKEKEMVAKAKEIKNMKKMLKFLKKIDIKKIPSANEEYLNG